MARDETFPEDFIVLSDDSIWVASAWADWHVLIAYECLVLSTNCFVAMELWFTSYGDFNKMRNALIQSMTSRGRHKVDYSMLPPNYSCRQILHVILSAIIYKNLRYVWIKSAYLLLSAICIIQMTQFICVYVHHYSTIAEILEAQQDIKNDN